MAKKVTSHRVWNILCFISLGLYATVKLLGLVDAPSAGFTTFLRICDLLVGIMILISAWNAVAKERKPWRIAYWVFVIIVLVATILPIVL